MVASLANNVAGLVSGSGPPAGTTRDAEYHKGDPYNLSADIDADTGAFAPMNQNELNTPTPIEFVHYGLCHIDIDKNFVGKAQAKEDQSDPAAAEQSKQGRAPLFRDSLIREAIMLHGYIYSCKEAVTEYKNNLGLVGMASDLGGVADNLLGGSDSSSQDQPPDPQELDKFMDAIKNGDSTAGTQVIQAINVSTIVYAGDSGVHMAGQNLHTVRSNYDAFTTKLEKQYLPQPPPDPNADSGGIFGTVKGLASKGMDYLPWFCKLPLKMFDIWIAQYLYMRWAMEDGIVNSSYRLTMQAIAMNQTPSFPMWSTPLPDTWKDSPDSSIDSDITETVDQRIGSIYVDAAFKVLKSGDSKRQDREGKSDQDSQTQVDSMPDGDDKTKAQAALDLKKHPYTANDCFTKSLIAILSQGSDDTPDFFKLTEMPGFLTSVISELTDKLITYLEMIYMKILVDGEDQTIDQKFLEDAFKQGVATWLCDDFITNTLDGISQTDMGPLGTPLKDLNLAKMIRDEIAQVMPDWADAVLDIAIGSHESGADEAAQLQKQADQGNSQAKQKLQAMGLGSERQTLIFILEDAQAKAKAANASTMEVYLSRLPWVTTLMFRNTFFPMWSLLIDHTIGKSGGPYKSIMDGLAAAQGAMNSAKNALTSVGNAAQSVDNAIPGGGAGLGDAVSGITGDSTVQGALGLFGTVAPDFPIDSRVTDGTGQVITADDANEAKASDNFHCTDQSGVPFSEPCPTNRDDSSSSDSSSSSSDSSSGSSDSSSSSGSSASSDAGGDSGAS